MRRVWKDRLQTLLFLGVLLIAAAWTGWLTLRQVKPMFEERVQAPLKHEPDYIIEQFSMVRVSKTGQTVTQMTAPKLTHYPDDDSAEIVAPRVTARAEDGSSTTDVVAAAGKILRGGEEVQLSGNVMLTRTPLAPAAVMQLNTEYLQVFPDTEIMQTNAPAKGSRGATRFEVPGFIVDNGQRTTEMSGPGRIVLAPKGS
jgi:lipopolysaccharide export system protein LptC